MEHAKLSGQREAIIGGILILSIVVVTTSATLREPRGPENRGDDVPLVTDAALAFSSARSSCDSLPERLRGPCRADELRERGEHLAAVAVPEEQRSLAPELRGGQEPQQLHGLAQAGDVVVRRGSDKARGADVTAQRLLEESSS